MDLIKPLQSIGLSEGEAKLYLGLTELGPSDIAKMARKAGVKRTSVYLYLRRLEGLGLIGKTVKQKRIRYYATNPVAVLDLLKDKETELEKALPELKNLYHSAGIKPRIEFFTERQGIMQLGRYFLRHGEGKIVKSFEQVDLAYDYFSGYLAEAVKIRIERGIVSRVIMTIPERKEIKEGLLRDKEELRETRLISKTDYPFQASIGILGDLTIFLVYVGEPLGILVESRELSKTFEAIFDLAWHLLGREEQQEL